MIRAVAVQLAVGVVVALLSFGAFHAAPLPLGFDTVHSGTSPGVRATQHAQNQKPGGNQWPREVSTSAGGPQSAHGIADGGVLSPSNPRGSSATERRPTPVTGHVHEPQKSTASADAFSVDYSGAVILITIILAVLAAVVIGVVVVIVVVRAPRRLARGLSGRSSPVWFVAGPHSTVGATRV